jgi:hypothetical protein
MQDLGYDFLRTPQRVEKVGFELIATTNWAQNAPKTGVFVPDLGRKRPSREFFNTLTPSRHLVNNASWGARGLPVWHHTSGRNRIENKEARTDEHLSH